MPQNKQAFVNAIVQSLGAGQPNRRPLIAMRGIRKSYYIGQPNELEILHGIDLTVWPGEFVAIVGESGSGKSTLMNAGVMQREQQVRAFEGRMLELSATACYTVGQLAVNGASLMDAGITPGPAVGKALNTLLRAVMEGRLPNEKAALLAALEKEGLL